MSFITSIANEIQDLHRQLDQFAIQSRIPDQELPNRKDQSSSKPSWEHTITPSHMKFYQQSLSGLLEVSANLIIQFLNIIMQFQIQTLAQFSRTWDRLYKLSHQYAIPGSRLLSNHYLTKNTSSATTSATTTSQPLQPRQTATTTTSSSSSTLSTRYLDAITTPKQFQSLQHFCTTQKTHLLSEARALQGQYSSERKHTIQMEGMVMDIASMVGQFVSMIEQQGSVVEEVHEMSQMVTSNVTATQKELDITIERTTSHAYSMAIVMIILAVMLLGLHWLTP